MGLVVALHRRSARPAFRYPREAMASCANRCSLRGPAITVIQAIPVSTCFLRLGGPLLRVMTHSYTLVLSSMLIRPDGISLRFVSRFTPLMSTMHYTIQYNMSYIHMQPVQLAVRITRTERVTSRSPLLPPASA